jgi:glycosyltransferase involved in cell wall biosynthesis
MSLRVLYLNSGNLFGGIETLLVTLAECRKESPDMEPEFGVCFAGRFQRALEEAGVPVHNLGPARMSKPWQVWRARRNLQKVLRERRPDIVVCHGSWSQALLGPVARQENLPLVYWVHDRITLPLPWQERWAKLTPPDLTIANSGYTAVPEGALYPQVETKIIYCALRPPQRHFSAEERAAFRTAQNTDPSQTVILQVSRLDPHKGHRLHLEALGRIASLNWVCWMVAAPQRPAEKVMLEELQQRARELGIADKMRFLGWQESIELVMEAADIFCQPNSGPEPFGLTYVEALWRGKPVVTTAMGGALEVLTPECGILTQPGDVDSLAEALAKLIENPELRQSMGAQGPARAYDLCAPANRLPEIEKTLREVVERRRK